MRRLHVRPGPHNAIIANVGIVNDGNPYIPQKEHCIPVLYPIDGNLIWAHSHNKLLRYDATVRRIRIANW